MKRTSSSSASAKTTAQRTAPGFPLTALLRPPVTTTTSKPLPVKRACHEADRAPPHFTTGRALSPARGEAGRLHSGASCVNCAVHHGAHGSWRYVPCTAYRVLCATRPLISTLCRLACCPCYPHCPRAGENTIWSDEYLQKTSTNPSACSKASVPSAHSCALPPALVCSALVHVGRCSSHAQARGCTMWQTSR